MFLTPASPTLSAVMAHVLATLTLGFMDGSEHFYASAPSYTNGTGGLVKLTDAVAATGARCLDGSPGAYYIRKGVGSGANKWYIHHQGGGWCESLDDCLGRSKGGLGSSVGYGPTSDMGGGYFSPMPSENPMMYNWNMVHLNYCDGGSFSGNNDTVTSYQNTSLCAALALKRTSAFFLPAASISTSSARTLHLRRLQGQARARGDVHVAPQLAWP